MKPVYPDSPLVHSPNELRSGPQARASATKGTQQQQLNPIAQTQYARTRMKYTNAHV